MLEFPHVSVEVQVRFITYSSTQLPATLTSDHATDGVGSHASSAVAVPVAAGSVLATHEMVVFAGYILPAECDYSMYGQYTACKYRKWNSHR